MQRELSTLQRSFRERLKQGLKALRLTGFSASSSDGGHTHLKKPVVVSGGPTVRNLKCVMCQGYIKIGLQYAKCSCGEMYHVSCLTRLGFCPMCNKPWTAETIKDITLSNGDISSSPYSKKVRCPSCDEMVSIFDLECRCGAIFVRENDSFLCPECGGRVSLERMICESCGEIFRDCEIVRCPSCNRNFDAVEGACECGAFLGERCPECGGELGAEDASCGHCGCQIETI
ncbi:MAG: Double zinc ribbon [Methanomassiliicoccales archaeon PtaU1.Bin124]|nr:MAG: Double zinc ribbon [Methanomassiliicoccales archaeon PtaU1.Bin124]